MLRDLRNSWHLLRIGYVLARHDALFVLEALNAPLPILAFCKLVRAKRFRHFRKGERLALALQSLGPSFIKLGQAISTRADLVGKEITDDLARLQDRIPPFPSHQALEIIEEEFGCPWQNLFADFDLTPVAAASIAQVHFAVTRAGEEVAVKILRPDVEIAFNRDIELFYWIAEFVERRLVGYRRLKPLQVVKTLHDSIKMELDLRIEASAAMKIRDNMKLDEGFRIPDVHWQLTSRQVMTMERVSGLPISDIAALTAAGHDLDQLLERAARSFFNQVFRDGFFHADLHPGNLFVDKDSNIVLVDFGITGHLDRDNRIYLAEILRGFLTEDYDHVARMHFVAGYVPATQSMESFSLACMAIAKPILGKPLSEISIGQLLGQLFAVSERFQMETQPQLLMLQKTMVLAEGVGRMLNPDINMWKLAEPLIEQWMRENLGVKAQARQFAQDGLDLARRLPSLLHSLDKSLQTFNTRGVTVHTQNLEVLNNERHRTHRAWIRLGWASLGAGLMALAMLTGHI
jgi:ubiquinone biosynthesis protein